MHNYVINHISCRAIGKYFFITGACLGGMGGMLLGMMERQAISVLGGMFLGLLAAVAFAIVGAVFAATFNVLSPMLGGIELTLSAAETPKAAEITGDAELKQQTLFPGE